MSTPTVTQVESPATPATPANSENLNAADLLKHVIPEQGYRYLSGSSSSLHNHPTIYAQGQGDAATLRVVGPQYEETFSIRHLSEALNAYRQLLSACGYTSER